MKFSDLFLATIIILIFMICSLVSYLIKGYKEIKENWVLYRCNPLMMPFAGYFGHDTEENFGKCIGEMQKDSMTYFTAPIQAGQHALTQGMGNLSNQLNDIRKLQSKLRPAIAGNFFSLFNIFGNIISAFHQYMNAFKDLSMRLVGVLASSLYILQGQQMTGESIVKGPMMDAMRILSMGQIG